MRNPKYKVSFAYAMNTDNGATLFGKTDEVIMKLDELDFFFQVLSPTRSIGYSQRVKNLKKNEIFSVSFNELVDGNNMNKVLKITRK
jgi:hypothetical protein